MSTNQSQGSNTETLNIGFGEGAMGTLPFGGDPTLLEDYTQYFDNYEQPESDGSPMDLKINPRRDIFFARDGDLATVNGRDNIEQSAAIDAFNQTGVIIGNTDAVSDIYEVRSAIRDALRADPQIESVISVVPDTFDVEKNQLNFSVEVIANDEYRLPEQSLQAKYTTHEDGEEITYESDPSSPYNEVISYVASLRNEIDAEIKQKLKADGNHHPKGDTFWQNDHPFTDTEV